MRRLIDAQEPLGDQALDKVGRALHGDARMIHERLGGATGLQQRATVELTALVCCEERSV